MPIVNLALLFALLGSAGSALAAPPESEVPLLAHVAPEQCMLYASWSGMIQPEAASANHTEQLLAEPEVQRFIAGLEQAFAEGMQRASAEGDPRQQELATAAPLWARTLLTRPAALFVTRLEPRENSVDFEGGLIVQAGEAAAALDRSLTVLLSSEDQKPVEIVIGNRTFHKLAAKPDHVPVDVVWGVAGNYLMIGLGEGVVEGMNQRIRAQKEPAWLTELRQALPLERRSTVAYANVKRLIDSFAPLGGPSAEAWLQTLGLRQIGALYSVSGLDESGIVSKSLLTIDGQPRGLLALAGGEGVAAADLAHIPSDATFASCFSLQAVKLFETMLETAQAVQPEAAAEMERQLSQIETQLGLNFRGLLAALGNNWSIHAAKGDGGYVNSALVIEVWDRPRLFEAQDKLLRALQPEGLPAEANALRQTPFAGQTIFHYAPRETPLPFAPAWCLTDKQLVIGLYPQAVKAVLARKPGEKSLADSAPLQPLLAADSAPLSVSYYDTRELFEGSYWYAQILAPTMLGTMRQQGAPFDFDVGLLPAPRTIGKHLQPSVTVVRRTPRGLETVTQQTMPVANVGVAAPVAVALLLPAVQASREAARRMQSSNNLKQQGLALHNFHDTFGRLPAAYNTDKDGKPLLSWRVALLPFIEQQALYEEFHLDEPWDSDHNKKLIARMPQVYRSPNSRAAEGKTIYLGVGGKQRMLGAPTKVLSNHSFANGLRFADVTDGTSNTIVVVEASDALAVEWTKPQVWEPDAKDPLKGLVGLRPNGFLALILDGSVRTISKTVSAKNLSALFTRDGGELIER